MSIKKRITAAALATAGLTAGAVVLATPAMAAPGTANYNCGPGYTSVDVEFDRNAANRLVMTADLSPTGFNVPVGQTITATLDGVGTPQVTLAAGFYTSITLTSQVGFPTLNAAPAQIKLNVPGPPPIVITCNLVTDNGGWPV